MTIMALVLHLWHMVALAGNLASPSLPTPVSWGWAGSSLLGAGVLLPFFFLSDDS